MTEIHDVVTMAAAQLELVVTQLFVAVGVPEEDAALAAAALVDADLGGVESHGVLRTGVYLDRIRRGAVNPRPRMRIERRDAVVVLDADNGLGQVAGARAADEAVQLSGEFGVGVVGVRHSNHFGAAAYYGRRIASQGAIALVFTNGPPLMAPWGGAERVLGNNPICIAVPVPNDEAVVIDVSLTAVAGGKLLAAAARGESIPTGWAVDHEGEPMTDPSAAMASGLLLPLGAHKGAGLAILVDVLAGVLTGAGFGPGVRSIYAPGDAPNDAGHLMLALDVERFLPWADYTRRLKELLDLMRGVATMPGIDQVLMPGQPESASRAQRRAHGIPVAGRVVAELAGLCQDLDVPFPSHA